MSPSQAKYTPFVLPLVVGGALLLSFMPARFCGYGPPLSNALFVLLKPMTLPLWRLTSAIRQHTEHPALGDADMLSDELRDRDTMILAMQRRVRELELENAELQGLRRGLGDSYLFRRATVLGASSEGGGAMLQIDLGARDGIRPGFAVVEGANLVGRIIQVAQATSTLRPVTSAGLVEVLFAPPIVPREGLSPQRQRTCLLKATGNDLLTADDVDRELKIAVGDYARLSDEHGPETWPGAAQGMIVGRVTHVQPNPNDPLRQSVQVRPLFSPRLVDAVTILVPRPAGEAKP
jgi:cell shape-determining protein MreC